MAAKRARQRLRPEPKVTLGFPSTGEKRSSSRRGPCSNVPGLDLGEGEDSWEPVSKTGAPAAAPTAGQRRPNGPASERGAGTRAALKALPTPGVRLAGWTCVGRSREDSLPYHDRMNDR